MSSPFNEQKYKGLLEGLEVSEVLLSELEYSKRIDAEYYKPSYLKYETIIRERGGVFLSKISKFLIGPLGSAFTVDNYVEEKAYRYIRGKDVKSMRLMDDDNVYMPKNDFNRLSKYALKENDILISVVGTIGNAAIISKKDLPAIFSCKRTVLRTFSINPKYLVVYLNTKYGKELLLRKERGAIQKGLNLDDLKNLDVYVPNQSFQIFIEKMYDDSLIKREQSKQLYHQAEELLLETIGLKDFKPSQEGKNIKSFKESFLSTGRLDAEYYQPKYDDYLQLIKNYSNGYELLQTICHLEDDNYTPAYNQEYKYIELSDVGKSGNLTGCTTAQGRELPTRARRRVNKNDVIISSIEGSLESCALIAKDYDNALCSTGFYVINSSKMNSETLLVLFKSELMQNILKQNCSGTILTAINKTEFQNIPIPLIDYTIQQQIAGLIEESFALRRESEKLLEEAKGMVEREIEK